MGEGSNAWAVSGWHSKTGKPLLAYDPHLESTVPSQWYQVRAHYFHKGVPHNVAGGSPPGYLGVLGRNDYAAAGLTVIYMDNQDFYK